MIVNHNNIQRWIFDYFEGNLSLHEQIELREFIKRNPEYKDDFEDWENVRLTEDTVPIYANAEALMVKESMLSRKVWAIAGVLILLRPGFAEIGFGAAVVLGGAVSYACSNMCIKKLTTSESVVSTTLWVNILMCPLAGIPAAAYWVTPTRSDLFLLIGVGVTGTAGIWFITRAYAVADMSAVVPFDFLRLPIVGAAGWVLFGEPTDIWTVAGAVMIFSSAYLLARSESRNRPAHE